MGVYQVGLGLFDLLWSSKELGGGQSAFLMITMISNDLVEFQAQPMYSVPFLDTTPSSFVQYLARASTRSPQMPFPDAGRNHLSNIHPRGKIFCLIIAKMSNCMTRSDQSQVSFSNPGRPDFFPSVFDPHGIGRCC